MRSAPSVGFFAGKVVAAGTLGTGRSFCASPDGYRGTIEERKWARIPSQGTSRLSRRAKARLLSTVEGIFVNLETDGLMPVRYLSIEVDGALI